MRMTGLQYARHQRRRTLATPLIAVAAILLLMLASGCGNSGNEVKVRLKDAPADIESVYRAHCLSCHGSELQGLVGGNTNLQQVGERMSFEDIATRIQDGGGLMQPYKDVLSEEEISGLAAWLAGSGGD